MEYFFNDFIYTQDSLRRLVHVFLKYSSYFTSYILLLECVMGLLSQAIAANYIIVE